MKKSPTINDVARLSGFSIGTVSKVLSGNKTISATTASAVRRAADELKYISHYQALARQAMDPELKKKYDQTTSLLKEIYKFRYSPYPENMEALMRSIKQLFDVHGLSLDPDDLPLGRPT